MGKKNTKKKKEKMKDFVKPKLKVGRKLQRQNATQTNFKTLTIALPNQLQSSTEEPLSQRKQSLQVNTTMRMPHLQRNGTAYA